MIIESKLKTITDGKEFFDKKYYDNLLNELNSINSIEDKFSYMKQIDEEKVKNSLRRFYEFQKTDSLVRSSNSTEIATTSSDILNSIDKDVTLNIINGAIKEYWSKGQSNSIASGISAYRGNYAQTAGIIASGIASQIDANNKNSIIQNAFSNDIFNITFKNTIGALSEDCRKYAIFAWRLKSLGIEPNKSRISLFSIVFNNGNCRAFAKNESDQVSRAMIGEFLNRFNQYILAPREAIIILDEIKLKNSVTKTLMNSEKLKISMDSGDGTSYYIE